MYYKIKQLRNEISKIVVGQKEMIDALLIGLFTEGHILLEGVPGLAKTTTVKAISQVLSLNFNRIQFTPDLLPSDIVGTEIFDFKTGEFKIKKGPIFTNLLLADEINRAPAKVQSALLEVMQEKQVTISDTSYKLVNPFLVLATQNPIESEGAYQLPEAQLDRFMFKIIVGYNTKEEEYEIAKRIANGYNDDAMAILSRDDIFQIKKQLAVIHMDEAIERYIVELIFASREPKKYGLSNIAPYIQFGASPRATIDMFKAVKAKAFLRGNDFVTPVDVALIIKDILRHRIILSYEAEAEGITTDMIIEQILQKVHKP